MRTNLLAALSDNIVIDKSRCITCGVCVETCILDNLRLKQAPCSQGCPLGVNVQGYIQAVRRGNDEKAREILREKLIFPEILGRVCPAPCENNCHRGAVGGGAVAARAIKRYLMDGRPVAERPLPPIAEKTGKRIAVVGSGPAGLQAAHDLASTGHQVTILESAEHPGGMLRWAIPAFRLPGEVLERALSLLAGMGVVCRCGVSVGRETSLPDLQKKYDAVVLATGCGVPDPLNIAGEDMAGVHRGLDVLKAARAARGMEMTGSVVVIGGGNVAMDAAQVALRLGAEKVTVISLETVDELPAFPEEIEHARRAGVAFEHSWGPLRIFSEGNRVSGVELQRCLAVFDGHGAFRPEFDSCTLKIVEANEVIVAIGQHRDESLFRELGEVDACTRQAGDANLFLAGDCHTGPSSVVEAMAGGREAAESVNRFLAGEHLTYGRAYAGPIETGFEIDTSPGSDADRAEIPRRVCAGKGDFSELEATMREPAARTEAGRCYACGQPFGKFKTCWFCLPCEVECPEDALWVEIPYLLR